MKYTIHVTEERISKGISGDCGKCPIALAIHDETTWKKADVTYGCVFKDSTDSWNDYGGVELPELARDFIADFDHGRVRNPFTFELELPEESL